MQKRTAYEQILLKDVHIALRFINPATFPRNAGDCSRHTAKIASAFGTGATSALTLRIYIVVVSVWMNSAPTMAPTR